MKLDKPKINNNVRLNILKIIIIIISIILLAKLFHLQIINGKTYRETSNTRLSRESTLEAARGYIYDTNKVVLAGTEMGFKLELYRNKISDEVLNNSILKIINILEKHEDKYIDNFPIDIKTFSNEFSTEEKFNIWKEKYDIDEEADEEAVFKFFKEKYNIENVTNEEARKIIAIRYEITVNGYSAIKPLTIANNISRDSALELMEQEEALAGINISLQAIRTYPQGSLASHIIGYIGRVAKEDLDENKEYSSDDYIGRSGIEYVFEKYLRGQDGIKQIDMNIDGTIVEEYIYQEAVAGNNITLTIDSNLQKVAEQALKDNIEKIKAGGFTNTYDAKAGAVVVMKVDTGEILSMVSYPDFEPELFINGISTQKWNEYNQEDVSAMFNRAIQGGYSPGSIFKMVTAIAGLEEGYITTTEKILTRGKYPYAHNPVCWVYSETGRNHGLIDVSDALKYSCNYFFYEVGRRMGIEPLEKYAKYFGLGSKTGVELAGEVRGTLATRENLENTGQTWYLGNTLSSVIGQGQNSYSPLQIARYISILVNGGNRINPTLIKSIETPDGTSISTEEINNYVKEKLNLKDEDYEEIDISEENLKAVLKGMKSVTEETDGTAYSAFRTFDIEVGGKTGSAEAVAYTNGWFVGFAPYDKPEIVVVVLVENGNKGSYTAEVARKIMDEYFNKNKIETKEDVEAKSY